MTDSKVKAEAEGARAEGDSSVSEVLPVQAQGPNIKTQKPQSASGLQHWHTGALEAGPPGLPGQQA